MTLGDSPSGQRKPGLICLGVSNRDGKVSIFRGLATETFLREINIPGEQKRMSVTQLDSKVAADVKCYHCGHVSCQIIGRIQNQLKIRNFIPRPGYKGPEIKPGSRLRCERCDGPVFLEEARQMSLAESRPHRGPKAARSEENEPPKAA